MRFAIATSPSRVSSGTTPISRRYSRTGSFVFSSAPAERSSSMSSSSASSSSSVADAAACSSSRSSQSATGMFEPSSFCSTSSMSSGDTTLSGNSRFRSSNVRYFLSPPSSSSRSITSSRSLSSIVLTVYSSEYLSDTRGRFVLWLQHRLALRRELNLLSRKFGESIHVLFPLGDDQFPAQLFDPLLDFHQPECRNTLCRDVMLV